jgi:beta-carotene 3-hydroxylase
MEPVLIPHILHILIVLAVFASMEVVAWAAHKYVMHGFLWSLHESHHRPRTGPLEKNDWFGVFFSLMAMSLFYAGFALHPYFLSAGLGMTSYGLAYLFLHDILNHKRFGIHIMPKSGYLRSVLRSHRMHHARREKDGCISFGFLIPLRFPEREQRRLMLEQESGNSGIGGRRP